MKPAIRVITYVLILAIGLVAGLYFGSRFSQARSVAFDMAEFSYYSAIRGFLALNKKRKEHPSLWLTEKVLATDFALAYARLAALAQKRGATQEAQQYLNRAVSFCPQIGWKECSAEKLNNVVHRLDRTGIFKENDPNDKI